MWSICTCLSKTVLADIMQYRFAPIVSRFGKEKSDLEYNKRAELLIEVIACQTYVHTLKGRGK